MAENGEANPGATALRLDRQLCFMLYACSRAMTKAYQPMLKALGITYPQYLVLMVLWEWAEVSPREASVSALGLRLQLDSGTLTPLLKRLEGQGFLVRERDTEDERRVLVRATPLGLALEADALAWVSGGAEALEAGGPDVDGLRSQLQVLHKALLSLSV